MYVDVSLLPESVRTVLGALKFHKESIELSPCERVYRIGVGSDGQRCFCAVVPLDGSEPALVEWGSWGGANAFSLTNAVDRDTSSYPMRPGFVVIRGSEGGRGVFARIEIHPSNLARYLAANTAPITHRQRYILSVLRAMTSAGRKAEFERSRAAPSPEELTELVELGLITMSRSGALSVTTAGKNEAIDVYLALARARSQVPA